MAQAARSKSNESASKLYVALELSEKNWKLVLSVGGRMSEATVPARDLSRVLEVIARARHRFRLQAVRSCYEAGRDGFWLHRALTDHLIDNVVLDPSSIEVDRRARRAKTDRLDGRKLVALLIRIDRGDASIREVRVPSPEVEDARRISRELQRLKNERTAHANRIRGLLALIGRTVKQVRQVRGFLDLGWRGRDGHPLGPVLRGEIERELSRIDLVNEQIVQVELAQKELLKADSACAKTATQLTRIVGVGETSAAILSYELLGWRDFANRRQVAGAAGLAPTPYSIPADCGPTRVVVAAPPARDPTKPLVP